MFMLLKIHNKTRFEHTITLSFKPSGLSFAEITSFIANGKPFEIVVLQLDIGSCVGNSRELKRLHSPSFLPSSV